MAMIRIGHRGAAGHEPENTLRSFRRAIEIGVDFIETDLQRSADGKIVVIHDKRVDRTTDGTGTVSSLTVEQLKGLDASNGEGERVPTLDELLTLASGQAGLMLEIISPGIAEEVAKQVDASSFKGELMYASFHHAELLEIEKVTSSASRVALFEGVPVNPTAFLSDAHATHAGLSIDSVTADFVDKLRGAGFGVFVYTANDPRDIAMLKAMNISGIISDFPDRL